MEKHIDGPSAGKHLYIDLEEGGYLTVESTKNGVGATFYSANDESIGDTLSATNAELAGDCSPNGGPAAAKQFYKELFDSFDSLSQIGEDEGAMTLSDIIYLGSVILSNDGFVDSSHSSIKDIVKELPSADQWMTFLHDGPKHTPKTYWRLL